jgi:hypothetical protein
MSKQINCTVVGKATDTPLLVVDNGNPYQGQFESPTRVIFTVNDSEPPWGATIHFASHTARYVLPASPGAYEGPALTYAAETSSVQVVGDHFESAGKRWTWAMTTGFCDYKLFLDGGDLRSLLKQNQDLGATGRRVFLSMVNITDFNPDVYAGKGYYDRFAEYLAFNAEYGQFVEMDALPDSQLLGWNLGKCQAHWARVCDAVRGQANVFLSLTNEFDHGGNLVGQPGDYAKPAGILSSQGSAVQDGTPPSPGWDWREWHAADDPTHFSHEFYIWKGLSTGGTPKPTVISEHGRRINEGNADPDYIRTLTYASLANGCGLTIHCEDGKYSRMLGPNQAACVQTATRILAKGE